MEAQEIKTPEMEIVSNVSDKAKGYSTDTYTGLTDLLSSIENNTGEIPPAVKLLIDQLSDLKNFTIKLEADFHGVICDLQLNNGKKYTIYLGIYDQNYKQGYYNNKIIIDDKSYLFQTKDNGSIATLAQNIEEKNITSTDGNKEIIVNIIKQYKPLKSFE